MPADCYTEAREVFWRRRKKPTPNKPLLFRYTFLFFKKCLKMELCYFYWEGRKNFTDKNAVKSTDQYRFWEKFKVGKLWSFVSLSLLHPEPLRLFNEVRTLLNFNTTSFISHFPLLYLRYNTGDIQLSNDFSPSWCHRWNDCPFILRGDCFGVMLRQCTLVDLVCSCLFSEQRN